MFSDVVDDTSSSSTLTMGEVQLQVPRGLSPSTPSHTKLLSLNPASGGSELEDIPENGFEFLPPSFDNSYSYQGVLLNNDRMFSCPSPTSNTSFPPEAPFTNNQPFFNTSEDSGMLGDAYGLLTTAPTSFHGHDHDGQHLEDVADVLMGQESGMGNFLVPQDDQTNDSGMSISPISYGDQRWRTPSTGNSGSSNHFDFSFTYSQTSGGSSGSSNGSSSASADSPSRPRNGSLSSMPFPWESAEQQNALDQQSPEGPLGSSMINTLGDSIWTPTQMNFINHQLKNILNFNVDGMEQTLMKLTKEQLLIFVDLINEKYQELLQAGEPAGAARVQCIMVKVQQYIISSFVSEPTGSVCSVSTPTTTNASSVVTNSKDNSLERVAKMHRNIAGLKDAPYIWHGVLPPRIHKNPVYSNKVFLGGLPWDITEATLMQSFRPFGIIKIEWPGRDGYIGKPKGYAYALFDNEKQVKLLLQNCTHDYTKSPECKYFYKITSRKFRSKDVQIIPWALSDSNFKRCEASKIDPLKTVFVGAVHGMVNAEGLAHIMNDLFGNVIYAGIDTDKSKYPIGSARVTFNNTDSYMKAVTTAFVHVKTDRIDKKIQVDPYLEDATCTGCKLQQGPYFCREEDCFRYFCRTCFQYKHSEGSFRTHRPMMRATHNRPTSHGGVNTGYQQQAQVFGNNSQNNNSNGNSNGGFHYNYHYQNGNGAGQTNGHNQQQMNVCSGGSYMSNSNNGRQWNALNANNNGGVLNRNMQAMNQLNAVRSGGVGLGNTKINNFTGSTVGAQNGVGLNIPPTTNANNTHAHAKVQPASYGNNINNANGNAGNTSNRNFVGQGGLRQQQQHFQPRW